MVANDFGKPLDSCGNEQKLLVIAMGKMGGGELNLSSDIDLIFAYPEAGETLGAKRSVSNQQFFERLGQRLIASLDAQTVDGFVFRVDMRLRPYGQSGHFAHKGAIAYPHEIQNHQPFAHQVKQSTFDPSARKTADWKLSVLHPGFLPPLGRQK